MSEATTDLEYVKQALNSAGPKNNYPAIYVLWGCLIFMGYTIVEMKIEWVNFYWLIATPVGMLLSAYLGTRKDKSLGQQNSQTGKLYWQHFSVLILFIIVAITTQQHSQINLLVALAYCLAGIHLDRPMLWIGGVILITYLGTSFDIINNHIVVGGLIAIGCFLTAWFTAKQVRS